MIGKTLGHYQISERLGAGGMGEVYRAKDLKLGRDVAIKVLREELASDPERLRRFEQEARSASALNHPNIITIYDIHLRHVSADLSAEALAKEEGHGGQVGKQEDVDYIAMEFVEGKTLREILSEGPLPTKKLLQLATQTAEGLAKAHSAGIVHRDLKPENLMVTGDGYVKILDFGLAKLLPQPDSDSEAATITKEGTVAGVVMGTASYMSPEQALGKPLDARTDVFSLGAVLYEMATGTKAFQGETPAALFDGILHKTPAPSSSLNAELPADLDSIINKALAKNPSERYSSSMYLLQELESLKDEPVTAQKRFQSSVAVLPFANMSADPEQEYFCDGMAEEIISALTQVKGLRVVARTSAFAFKGKNVDVREISQKLGVDTVLEGSVRKAGNRLRISVQLIDVANDYHMWSERYDRELKDIFDIQDEIALAIVEKLEVKLLGGERAAVVKRHTDNLEAHNAYLVGLFEWNKMSPEGFVRCQELFQEAIRLDPEFAPAYARLADSFTSVTWWSDQPPTEALARALPLVEKALALDPNLAHAYSVLGHTSAFFQRDWAAGERSLRRAVDLAPSDALAQTYLALLLMITAPAGTEASERARMALRLDPLSPTNNVWAGTVLLFSGNPEEGLSVIERQVAMTPHLWMPRYWLSVGLASRGRFEEARVAGEKALELSGGTSLTQCNLATICYRLGDRQAGDALFARLQQRAQTGYVAPTFFTWAHLARGEPESALRCAEEALAAKDPWISTHHLLCPGIVPADPLVDDLLQRGRHHAG
jgi:serine/threonine protein kinase/Tfp pilus assembly protein PilF